MRNLSRFDRLLSAGSRFRSIFGSLHSPSEVKVQAVPLHTENLAGTSAGASALSDSERTLSGALMRVNHVGEVCAQALYEAQALVTQNPSLRAQMLHAAQEERRHLSWVRARLDQLGAKPSVLNFFWFSGAFGLGIFAGLVGDKFSLGFVAETERQVEAHLSGHLDRLPLGDAISREIVEKMRQEEHAHAVWAIQRGGGELAWPVRAAMRLSARFMTRVAHYL